MLFTKSQQEKIGTLETPFYYYDLALLDDTLKQAKAAADKRDFHVHYALKANFNDRVLETIQRRGLGADCVSGNEVQKAIDSGFSADKITFAGVGKSDKEIRTALAHGIFAFNVESIQEMEVIDALAAEAGVIANVSLRINPNVDAHTHHYITTGLDENKFGVPTSELEKAAAVIRQAAHVELMGLHFHVGSQITDMNVFKSLCVKVNEWKNWFEERGTTIRVLNVGGGLGVDYQHPDENPIPDFEAYFDIFDKFLERTSQQEVHFELGRALVAQCGSLLSKVLYTKSGIKKHFLVLDAGMTELMRPALYQAYHKMERVGDTSETLLNYDVVGPICESSDCFGKEVPLPVSKRGDLLAIRTAGAYGEVMASRYNLRDEIRYVYNDTL
ncbi:diaminopimelate decarboxylase [Sphingobacterium oryzagri]|uniref:Diaminopimelate decarboxylase n=1 Tax=Sphingobacterium oryzagri TaxID=3025669 RepID=A0ABY7WLX1_9SPHI|nr:diaminopimelate decarboxylase [Sphingobacterium sp. KACC 22765]WDF70597.1 diaminopimelate decarboxylase [Sphingobacterium sp. KACC 22765]